METIRFLQEQVDQLDRLRASYLSKKMSVWEEQSYDLATKEKNYFVDAIQKLKTLETLERLGIKTTNK